MPHLTEIPHASLRRLQSSRDGLLIWEKVLIHGRRIRRRVTLQDPSANTKMGAGAAGACGTKPTGSTGGAPGDALVEASVSPHSVFSRLGNEIGMELLTTIDEASLDAVCRGSPLQERLIHCLAWTSATSPSRRTGSRIASATVIIQAILSGKGAD